MRQSPDHKDDAAEQRCVFQVLVHKRISLVSHITISPIGRTMRPTSIAIDQESIISVGETVEVKSLVPNRMTMTSSGSLRFSHTKLHLTALGFVDTVTFTADTLANFYPHVQTKSFSFVQEQQ